MKHIKNLEWHYFQSVEEAANAAYLALRLDCAETGEDPSWEVQIYTPERKAKSAVIQAAGMLSGSAVQRAGR